MKRKWKVCVEEEYKREMRIRNKWENMGSEERGKGRKVTKART